MHTQTFRCGLDFHQFVPVLRHLPLLLDSEQWLLLEKWGKMRMLPPRRCQPVTRRAPGVQHPSPLPQSRRLCSCLPTRPQGERLLCSPLLRTKGDPTALERMCLTLPRPCAAPAAGTVCEQQLRVSRPYRLPLPGIVFQMG